MCLVFAVWSISEIGQKYVQFVTGRIKKLTSMKIAMYCVTISIVKYVPLDWLSRISGSVYEFEEFKCSLF